MFGIKKMLKDDDATGIVGAISACLPSSVCFGGFGAIVTLLHMIVGIISTGCCTLWTIGTSFCCCGCGTGLLTGAYTLATWGISCCSALIFDTIFATCVGGITSCVAALGAMSDYIICTTPIATVCLTPIIGVLAAAVSAICGAFGCSFTAATGAIGMLFNLGENIVDIIL
ncbi:MAG: hypothetical protein EF806_06835 [Candidatus Methanoliparum thermophilum]|uniref:Uncharacterized protein n=1 Tax=Methanoliparum thermophilum TaxID=2491083 RepID=A0A520KQW1_METT2|nr:MAG: hypothetical protein EF806_06835 [Candidatus Methanoliparum thermophilum]